MYDEFFKVCEFVNVQYTERLIDAVNTFQSVSSGFTWIFTSKTMKPVITEKYELLKDFKQKGYVEKIIDGTCDSVRIYVVGKNRTENNTWLLGKREMIEINDETFVW